MRKMSFIDTERNKNTLQTLSQALANRDKSVINTGSILAPPRTQQQDSSLNLGDLVSGGAKLYNGLKGVGLFGGESTGELGTIGNAANDFIMDKPDYGIFGNAANDSIMGTSGTGSAIGDAIGAEVGSGVSPMGWLSFGQGALNGLNQGFNHEGKDILGGFGNGVQGFFGVNENDSDVQQGIKGTLDGAMKGTMIFPGVGTIIGGLLGLGSSFLDDL